jgi:hypothetical protein
VTEAELQDAIAGMAQVLGWKVAHARPARTQSGWRTPWQYDGKGFPDLTLVKGARLVFAELKSSRGRLEPEQSVWLAALLVACPEVYVWTPDSWTSGEVERVLR